MALSRFWVFVFVVSILYIFYCLATGSTYSIDYIVNGKKDEPIIAKQVYLNSLPADIKDSLISAKDNRYVVRGTDTLYFLRDKSDAIVNVAVGKQEADGILPTCRNTILDYVIPLIGYLAFFCGILQLLIDSGASSKLASTLSPVFTKIFPELPANHPAIWYMMLNFVANFLGLDSAATPFGLKAMESLQEINPDKDTASNSQIMFLCLHAAGLTLIPISIISYRAANNAHNPADVVLPCIITSLAGTLAALILVGVRQRINFFKASLLIFLGLLTGLVAGLLLYITRLDFIEKNHFVINVSNCILLAIILVIIAYAWFKKDNFTKAQTDIFSSFVVGAKEGLNTAKKVFPYILGMLVAISLFRNSGVFGIISSVISKGFLLLHVPAQIVNALPVAILRPLSSGGSRGFMIDAMHTWGPDTFTGRLSCVFQCCAESTFYVIALYFGSVNIKNTRYALSTMLIVDLICVITGILVCLLFFPLQ